MEFIADIISFHEMHKASKKTNFNLIFQFYLIFMKF